MMDEIIMAESFDGAYMWHKAHSGAVVALCGKPLMRSVKELPLTLWRFGEGCWCQVCDTNCEVSDGRS